MRDCREREYLEPGAMEIWRLRRSRRPRVPLGKEIRGPGHRIRVRVDRIWQRRGGVWPEVVRGTEVLLIVLVAIRVVRRHCSSSGGSR